MSRLAFAIRADIFGSLRAAPPKVNFLTLGRKSTVSLTQARAPAIGGGFNRSMQQFIQAAMGKDWI